MSTSADIITNLAIELTSTLHDRQAALFIERYAINIIEPNADTKLVLSDILPFHPLFVESMKLEYIVPSQTPKAIGTNSEIRIVIELRAETLK